MKVKLGFEYEFFVFDETPHSVRAKGLSRPETADARQLRLFGAARVDPLGPVHRTDGLCDRARLSARGAALRDRSRRLGRRACGDRCARRVRPRESVQDVHEGLLREARADGDVHGQVVDEVSGPERSLPFLVLGRRRREPVLRRNGAVSDERRAAARARRAAPLSAGVHRAGRADHQQLHAARERRVGADRVHVGRRKPYDRDPGDPRFVEIAASRVPGVRRGCESVSRRVGDHRRRAARRHRTARTGRAVTGNAYDVADRMEGPGRFPGRSASGGRTACGVEVRRAGCSAMRSSTTSCRAGLWEAREYTRSLNDWQLERYFEII